MIPDVPGRKEEGIHMKIREMTAASGELPALEAINEEVIPEMERCALADMLATGAKVFCIDVEGEPAGYMAVRCWRNFLYLAFLAVRADLRSAGIGGEAVRELIRRYPDRQVVVEYEAPDVCSGNRDERLRRKGFYLRNGFHETGWRTCYDGTEFEIGCSVPDFDAEGFKAFADYLAGIVSDHIPNPYYESGTAPEDTLRMPDSIAAVLGGRNGKTDGLGKSGAQVLLFEDYVLKIRPAGGWDTADVQILRWLAGKAPVPQVAAHEVMDGRDWLLMTRIRGKELCKPEIMNQPVLLLDCMAEALHTLWSIPVDDCPFEKSVADNLAHAEKAILDGRFDPSDCEPETFGPGGFENPKALLDWLKSHRPGEDRVVTHGDFCLPNLFTDGKKFTGFIDVGSAGAGDRWMDLALGWRSLKHNSDGHYGKVYPDINPDDLFRAAGVPKDEEKLRYYILLDELN